MDAEQNRCPSWIYWEPSEVISEEVACEKRSFKERLLIAAWVMGYAGLLFLFRTAKGLENLSKRRIKAESSQSQATEKNE